MKKGSPLQQHVCPSRMLQSHGKDILSPHTGLIPVFPLARSLFLTRLYIKVVGGLFDKRAGVPMCPPRLNSSTPVERGSYYRPELLPAFVQGAGAKPP